MSESGLSCLQCSFVSCAEFSICCVPHKRKICSNPTPSGGHGSASVCGYACIDDQRSNAFRTISNVLCIGISAYGLYAFLSWKLIDYMLLKTRFVFFDCSESVLRFMPDYAAIIVLFGVIGYYIAKLFRAHSNTRRKNG